MPYTSGNFLNNKVGFKVGNTPVDFSDHVTSFALVQQADQISVTAMGDTANKFVTGLSSDTITVTLLNDRGTGSILQTLQNAYGSTIAFKAIQVYDEAVSATNVLYTGTILIDSIPAITGTPADESMIDLTFTCNSKTAVATTGTW